MSLFLIGLVILAVGGFFYGRFVEKSSVPTTETRLPRVWRTASTMWKCPKAEIR